MEDRSTPRCVVAIESLESRQLLAAAPVIGATKISFQPVNAPTVSGYIRDSGLTYAARNGKTYGWTVSHTDVVYDRNINSNQLLDTVVGFKAATRWELAVPNGKYSVRVGVGDAKASSTNNIWVEGVQAFNRLPLAANKFSSATITVNVTDGKLTMTPGGVASGLTKVNFIEVTPVNASTIQLGTIFPLGDSITYGYEHLKSSTGGYRNRLYTNLQAASAGFTYAGTVVDKYEPLKAAKLEKHEGHGAFRTDQIANNLLGVAPGTNVSSNNGGYWLSGTGSRPAVNPQIVLLHIGTNDILQKVAPTTAAANLDKIIKIVTDVRPSAKVFVSTIIPMQDAARMSALKTYNQLLKDVVAKYRTAGKKVVLVDMYSKFVDASGNARPSLFSDPVHPSRAGYDVMGDTWSAAILANR